MSGITSRLIVGTRGSSLALTQARWAMELLRRAHPALDIEERVISTRGDKIQDVPLANIGQKGLFIKEIETALGSGAIDAAVHSLKDLPSDLDPAFTIAAMPPREDPRDCLVSPQWGSFRSLPAGAVVGTGSPRRSAQLLGMRPDLRIRDIRGNVDTRIRKTHGGEYDAIVLAMAGLKRLGLEEEISEVFDTTDMIPAVGQAVLALETRCDDGRVIDIVSAIDDAATRAAAVAERAFARNLGASCTVPVGALATTDDDVLELHGALWDIEALRAISCVQQGACDDPETLGVLAADTILGHTEAREILERYRI